MNQLPSAASPFACRHGFATRRHFLATQALGLGGVALACLLHEDGLLAEPVRPELEPQKFDLAPKKTHHPARARAMISLFMQGGPSHIDLFDPKPALVKFNGTDFSGQIKYDSPGEASTKLLAGLWPFRRHGRCGTEISDLLPHLGDIVDDITLIRSMHTGVNNHNESIRALQTGRQQVGRPALGSWLAYGLGTETRNLPAFVALYDGGALPIEGVHNWSSGWLPSLFQGTVIRPREPRILNLEPAAHLRGEPQRRQLAFMDELNRRHLHDHPGESDLEARIAGYELAARMQTAAREALDIAQETAETRRLYGLDDPATRDFGSRCLIARRLVERGVRFVQVFTRGHLWDHHGGLATSLPAACRQVDRPSAALVTDLKRRGLLDSTIVHWGGEMGRLPVIQNPANIGRDHNTFGFSAWVAGGGFKRGHVHGETDEFGHRAARDVVTYSDYLATLLHLFGLDAQRLVHRRNGQPTTLTGGQPCRVVREILQT